MNLEHVALNVENAAETVKWWCDTLGMRVVVANDEAPYIHFIVDSVGQSMLEIYTNPAGPIPDYASINVFSFHVAFTTDAIESERERLIGAGATAEGEITPTPEGHKLAFFRDPSGIPFQLVQRVAPLL